MSCDLNLEIKVQLYEDFLAEGYSEQEAAELAEQKFQEMD